MRAINPGGQGPNVDALTFFLSNQILRLASSNFPDLQPLTIQLRESQASLGSNMMSIEQFEPTASARECKKRKRVSEAEKAATELSKLVCELYKLSTRRTQECHARFENKRVRFPNSKQSNMFSESCNLTDHRQHPCSQRPSSDSRYRYQLSAKCRQECHARFENKRVHFPNSKQNIMFSESCNLITILQTIDNALAVAHLPSSDSRHRCRIEII